MTLRALFILILFSTATFRVAAQQNQWHHSDPETDSIEGLSTNKAYELLKSLPSPQKFVLVAVIDGGVDSTHEDLKSVLWVNMKEIAGNKKDDDKNGYADDINGWNFLGDATGKTLTYDQKEETRLYSKLKLQYDGKGNKQFPPAQQAEYKLYQQVKPYYELKAVKAKEDYIEDSTLLAKDIADLQAFKKASGLSSVDTSTLKQFHTADTSLMKQVIKYSTYLKRSGQTTADALLNDYRDYNAILKRQVDYAYNIHYNPRRSFVQESGRFYGNAYAAGSDGRHGTHVAGIIGADRDNSTGVKGIASFVKIMSVKAIPQGDERDQDVANAIRYAVDNGAQIICMSFGKYFSPQKQLVDDAIRYADKKGVFLIHAAGNDHVDLDSAQAFPTGKFLNGTVIPNMITVGATGPKNDKTLVARFSNYGKESVDVFAPGVLIMSTLPGNKYDKNSGTSMAAPMVAGVAALLKAYFPTLSPADIKRIIVSSVNVYHTPVVKPGTKLTVDFATLSKSGGIVNLSRAVRQAMLEQDKKKINK